MTDTDQREASQSAPEQRTLDAVRMVIGPLSAQSDVLEATIEVVAELSRIKKLNSELVAECLDRGNQTAAQAAEIARLKADNNAVRKEFSDVIAEFGRYKRDDMESRSRWLTRIKDSHKRVAEDLAVDLAEQAKRHRAELVEAQQAANLNAAERDDFAAHMRRCCGHEPYRLDQARPAQPRGEGAE